MLITYLSHDPEIHFYQEEILSLEFYLVVRHIILLIIFRLSQLGLQTSQDARFYALSRKFSPFTNKDKPLVIQFSVKHEQNIDCGGGYLKIFDCKLEGEKMHGESPYEIMFGPDICGPGTKKVIYLFRGKILRS